MGFAERLDQWQEFYIALAGVAATLLGLVFVGLVLYLQGDAARSDPTGRSLPVRLAAHAWLNYIYAVLLALTMIAPYRPPYLPGVVLLCIVLTGLLDWALELRKAWLTGDRRPAAIVTSTVSIACFLLLMVASALLIARETAGVYLVPLGAAGLLAAATHETWRLVLFSHRDWL